MARWWWCFANTLTSGRPSTTNTKTEFPVAHPIFGSNSSSASETSLVKNRQPPSILDAEGQDHATMMKAATYGVLRRSSWRKATCYGDATGVSGCVPLCNNTSCIQVHEALRAIDYLELITIISGCRHRLLPVLKNYLVFCTCLGYIAFGHSSHRMLHGLYIISREDDVIDTPRKIPFRRRNSTPPHDPNVLWNTYYGKFEKKWGYRKAF